MKRKYTKSDKEQQILVLQSMLEKQDLLFGKFSGSSVTKIDIDRAWTQIVSLALSYGLITNPNVDNFRRLTWQDWRRKTMAKVDRMKKTGVGGASPTDILDEGDKLILAIVIEEIAYGLDIPESDGANINVPPPAPVEDQSATTHLTCPFGSMPKTQSKQNKNAQKKYDMEVEEHIEKMKLIKANYYCRHLEAREREINLGLPLSVLTSSLYLTEGNNDECFEIK